jgi:hypothetical protein
MNAVIKVMKKDNKEPRNKPTHMLSKDFSQRQQCHTMEKGKSLQ